MLGLLKKFFLGRTDIEVGETTRTLVYHRGQLLDILSPGTHRMPYHRDDLKLVHYNLSDPLFDCPAFSNLSSHHSALVRQHFHVYETQANQVAVIRKNRKIWRLLPPNEQLVVWKNAGPWQIDIIDLSNARTIPAGLVCELEEFGPNPLYNVFTVPAGFEGLLAVNGNYGQKLGTGRHGFWVYGNQAEVKLVDMRQQIETIPQIKVCSQEGFYFHLDLAAQYQIVDCLTVETQQSNLTDLVNNTLSSLIRKITADKKIEDLARQPERMNHLICEQANPLLHKFGIRLSHVWIKNIHLPTRVEDCLNEQAAKQLDQEKQQDEEPDKELNSLVKKAKILSENPTLLVLKELDLLERLVQLPQRLHLDKLVIQRQSDQKEAPKTKTTKAPESKKLASKTPEPENKDSKKSALKNKKNSAPDPKTETESAEAETTETTARKPESVTP